MLTYGFTTFRADNEYTESINGSGSVINTEIMHFAMNIDDNDIEGFAFMDYT